jgi:hypothetical protein
MKVGGPGSPLIDPGRRLDQVYGVKAARQPGEAAGVDILDTGRLLKGRVVSVDGDGVLTVATDAGLFTAASATPLEVGREFWFQVVSTGTTPLLAEAGKANAVLNLLRVLLPGMLAMEEAVAGPAAGAGQELNQETDRLAQFLQANTVDATPDPVKLIKSISQLTLSQPSGGQAPGGQHQTLLPLGSDSDLPGLQKLARMLEAHAVINQQPAAAGGSNYLIFPVFFAEQGGRGEWMYSFEQEGDAGADPEAATASLSFYLAMSQLGDIHLSLTSRSNQLTGVFTLATPAAADHVRQHLPQLVKALQPMAGSVSITCRSAKFDCLKVLKDDLTAKAGIEHFALVDVKA